MSWLLLKPSDQDLHCFPLCLKILMLTSGMDKNLGGVLFIKKLKCHICGPLSRVKHSTTEPLCSLKRLVKHKNTQCDPPNQYPFILTNAISFVLVIQCLKCDTKVRWHMLHLSCGIRFPTMWHFDMTGLR